MRHMHFLDYSRILPKIFLKPTRMLLLFLLAITVFALCLPLFLIMPRTGLDPSWTYGVNQAVAQGLVFGKEFIFTFGPYAGIRTHAYHPETDNLIMWGGLYLGICYVLAILYLSRETSWVWLLVLWLILAGLIYLKDILLLSYPLLISLIVYRMTLPINHPKKLAFSTNPLFFIILLFSPLGLLSVLKGSLLLICVPIVSLCFLIFWIKKEKTLAAACIGSPCIAGIIFWIFSGQPITGLYYYFLNMFPIILGYSEAMAISGDINEIIIYLLAAGGVLFIIGTIKNIPWTSKLFLFVVYAVFLFLVFKTGFVRHDQHAIVAGTSILIAVILLPFSIQHKFFPIVLLLTIVAWGVIDRNQVGSSNIYVNIKSTYLYVSNGIKARTEKNILKDMFNAKIEAIKQEFPIPIMDGTADIYSFNQAYLLASGNKWSPRPIFQSYSAYTAGLANLNALHLTSERAPDNIIFKVESIDGRLPALEDGVSWPIILNNYLPINIENDFLYLTKKSPQNITPIKQRIYNETHLLGEDVALPAISKALFAKIDLHPTIIGHLRSILYKPEPIEIHIELINGMSKSYRFISSMAKSGFYISPLINNTKDFALLFSGIGDLNNNIVKSIRISPEGGSSMFWNDEYILKLSHFELPTASNIYGLMGLSSIDENMPMNVKTSTTVECVGTIDHLSGINPTPTSITISRLLSLDGWLVISSQQGIAPEAIFVTLTDPNGKLFYIKAKTNPRPDVNQHLNQPNMLDVGYNADVDVFGLQGDYTLGLASLYQGKLEHCKQFNIPVSIIP